MSSKRSRTHYPAASSPVRFRKSKMDRRQTTVRNGAQNGTTEADNAHSAAIHSQRSPTIVQTPTCPMAMPQEYSCSDVDASFDPLLYSPGNNSFMAHASPFYQEGNVDYSWQHFLPATVAQDIYSTQMFARGSEYDTYPEEVIADSESAIHEVPQSEEAPHDARRVETNPKRKRETPLTEEERKERNREYSRTYRKKQTEKKEERDTALARAERIIRELESRLWNSELEKQRLGRRVYELEIENQRRQQRVIEPEGLLLNPSIFPEETTEVNLEARDSHLSDTYEFGDVENSSLYPLSSEGFQSDFQP